MPAIIFLSVSSNPSYSSTTHSKSTSASPFTQLSDKGDSLTGLALEFYQVDTIDDAYFPMHQPNDYQPDDLSTATSWEPPLASVGEHQPNDLSTTLSWESPTALGGDPHQLDDSSVTSDLSTASGTSSNASEHAPATAHETPPPPRQRANPSHLNEDWRNFFRNSLVAAEPIPTNSAHVGGTPDALPPPLHTAPNEPCGDSFATKPRGSFRVWSVNANGISSPDGFAELHTLCVSLKERSVDAIALQEPNTDFMKSDLREAYESIFVEIQYLCPLSSAIALL
jgi:hypothetical protein